jgi:hypothetical protein
MGRGKSIPGSGIAIAQSFGMRIVKHPPAVNSQISNHDDWRSG